MAQQLINIGSAPNDGTGDQARIAFDKCNQNFTELYESGAGSSTEGVWNFNQTSTDTTTSPSSGRFRTNSGDAATCTQLAIHRISINGVDRANTLRTQVVGDIIKMQDKNDADTWARLIVQAPPVDNGDWFQIDVAFDDGGGTPPGNNQEIIFGFTASGGGGGGGGGGASVTVSATPPASPTVGSLWWDTVSGQLYIWYDDGTSQQWVVSVNEAVSAPVIPPGQLVLIQRRDVSSAVASVDFTSGIDATYDEYELHFFGLTVAASGDVGLRISQDGGGTWKAGASDYAYQFAGAANPATGSAFVAANASYIRLATQNTGVSGPGAGVIRFFKPADTTFFKNFLFHTHMATVNFLSLVGSGVYGANTIALNGLRILSLAGNITAGTFILYGVKK